MLNEAAKTRNEDRILTHDDAVNAPNVIREQFWTDGLHRGRYNKNATSTSRTPPGNTVYQGLASSVSYKDGVGFRIRPVRMIGPHEFATSRTPLKI